MKIFLGLAVSLMFHHTALHAALNPSHIVCRGENVLQSNVYAGYVKSIE